MNKSEDPDKIAFTELLDCFNLQQHVQCPTHKSGNTLDLFITRSNDSLTLSVPKSDHYISDHCFVHTYLSKYKPKCTREISKFRKINRIDSEKFNSDLSAIVEASFDITDIDELAEFHDIQLRKTLNIHAPVVERSTTVRKLLPWFDENANILKRKVRRAESIARNNANNDNQFTYRELLRVYRKHLRVAKYHHINNAIKDAGKNSKKLYSMLSGMIGRNKENPMPSSESDQSLAEEFISFFLGKIAKIRDELDKFPTYDYEGKVDLQLTHFCKLSEEEVKILILQAKSTTCLSDPIPSSLLKQHLDVLLPLITRMVNISLGSGTFAKQWKESVIRPLIKKKGLDCVLKSYRPVSNLSFISKIVEKSCLNQFMSYLESNTVAILAISL